MKRLLLVSSSNVHGTGYLDHCEEQIRSLFDSVRKVLFVPYALFDRDAYAGHARQRFEKMGLGLDSLHDTRDPVTAVLEADGIFVGGGNTFRLLRELQTQQLIEPIRARVEDGLPYLGTSAGSNVACPTIRTTNDMPIVQPASFSALGLVSFQINAHYLDADPSSTHQGETREQRLTEYLEENATPVIALREGAMVLVNGPETKLAGKTGAVLFVRGQSPRELSPGSSLEGL